MVTEILKSKSDVKEYRLVQLECGLDVLMVSNMKVASKGGEEEGGKGNAVKAAAAMSVQVGSFSDPRECQGLAHFLEHMVFMGSEKYPEENYYDSFISSHGGSCNAMTEFEYTAYEFSVSAAYFDEALDIFAHCFKCPLLSMSSADREIMAIENEFNLAKGSDPARLQQLVCSLAREGHVLRQFSWGSLHSLKTIPTRNNVNVQDVLKRFHALHYIPSNMKLVVMCPKPLNEIEAAVRHSFEPWTSTNNGLPLKRNRALSNPVEITLKPQNEVVEPFVGVDMFGGTGKPMLTRMVPIKSGHKLYLTWQLPSLLASYRDKSAVYIGHLLGHEGPGSLLSHLKAEQLATEVSAGISSGGFDSNMMFSSFWVTVTLSEKGLANWMYAARAVFQCLELLRNEGPQEWIGEEIKRVAEAQFAFLDEDDEENFVEELSVSLLDSFQIKREDILAASFLYWDWKPDVITDLLQKMTVHDCHMYLASSMFSQRKPRALSVSEIAVDCDEERLGKLTVNHTRLEASTRVEEYSESGEEDEEEDDDEMEPDSDHDMNSSEDSAVDRNDDGSCTEDDEKIREEITSVELMALYAGPSEWNYLILPIAITCANNFREPLKEEFFETEYWADELPETLIAMLESTGSSKNNVPMHLPPPNDFIASNLELIPELKALNGVPVEKLMPPVRVQRLNGFELWHSLEGQFQLPKAEIYIRYVSPQCVQSAFDACCHMMMSRLIRDSLTELLYMSSMAELQGYLEEDDVSFTLRISGLSEKAIALASTLQSKVENPEEYITSVFFSRQLELLEKKLRNEELKTADAANFGRLSALKPSRITASDKLTALAGLKDAKQMFDYTNRFLGSLSVQCFVAGNVPVELTGVLQERFVKADPGAITLGDSNHPAQHVVCLSRDAITGLALNPTNLRETNVAVQFYFQCDRHSVEQLTKLELLEQLLAEHYFDNIRTKQQLGYSVSCGVRQTYGVLGFMFSVVSSSHSVQEVAFAMESFVKECGNHISALSDQVYGHHIEALIHEKDRLPTSLSDSTGVQWTEICERRYQFREKVEQAALLRRSLSGDMACLTKVPMSEFANRIFLGSDRRLLVIQAGIESQLVIPLGVFGTSVNMLRSATAVHAAGSMYPTFI